jgi:Flp pilus assembly protein TadG
MNFVSCTKGSVALVFSLTLIPVLALGGMALDYSRASSAKTAAQNAADAAALGAAQLEGKSDAEMSAFARTVYDTNMTGVSDTSSLTFTAVRKPEGVEVTANFQNKNYISSVVGGNTNAVNVKSLAGYKASSGGYGAGKYIDVYYLLDMSGSMDIPDGDSEIVRFNSLFVNPYNGGVGGCSFACHTTFSVGLDHTLNNNGKTGYQVARENGIILRQDRIKEAAISSLNKLRAASSGRNVRVLTRILGRSPSLLLALSENVDAHITAVQNYSPESGGTWLSGMLELEATRSGISGNGTATSPKKIYVLITDGMENGPSGGTVNLPIVPDYTKCDGLKSNGFDLYVLNLKYPNTSLMEGDTTKVTATGAIASQVADALQRCASPGLYYSATAGVDITNKLNSITDHFTTGVVNSKLRIFK